MVHNQLLGALAALLLLTGGVGAQPANDDCSGALLLSVGGADFVTSTTGASFDGYLLSCGNFFGPSLWFEIVPTADETLTVTATAPTSDLDLALYSSCSGINDEIVCADDGFFGGQSEVLSVMVSSGTSIYVRVSTEFQDDVTINVADTLTQAPRFIRSDINEDGSLSIGDAIALLGFLFAGLPGPACSEAADVNSDGSVSLTDAVAALAYLFQGGSIPAPPFPDCGELPSGVPSVGCGSSGSNCP